MNILALSGTLGPSGQVATAAGKTAGVRVLGCSLLSYESGIPVRSCSLNTSTTSVAAATVRVSTPEYGLRECRPDSGVVAMKDFTEESRTWLLREDGAALVRVISPPPQFFLGLQSISERYDVCART